MICCVTPEVSPGSPKSGSCAAYEWYLCQEKEVAKVTIYHNPRCSKSRQTLQLIRDKGIEPEIVEYLKQPLNAAQIEKLLTMLDMQPRDLMRKKEEEYSALDLGDSKLSAGALIKAMAEHPVLIERPIVVAGNKAVLGRPPEQALKIL